MTIQRDDIHTATAIVRIVAACEVSLILVTWKLWTAVTEFPVVPLFPMQRSVALSSLSAAVLFVAASVVALSHEATRARPIAAGISLVAGLLCVTFNQQCLQPWHWLFLVLTGLSLVPNQQQSRRLMQHVIATLYVCAALSRITPTPLDGMTGSILRQLLEMSGLDGRISIAVQEQLCHLMTGAELAAGILVLRSSTRVAGVVLAMLMHVVLIIALGPFGLNHHAPVVMWNACLLVVVPVLFLSGGSAVPAHREPSRGSVVQSGRGFVGGVSVIWALPLSGLVGVFDNWPSWQVYSPRPERWQLFVHVDDVEDLPHSLLEMTHPRDSFGDWYPVPLDRWSLETIGVPLYPEERFQRAVIRDALDAHHQTLRFRIEIDEPRSPDWWNRQRREIDGANGESSSLSP